MRVRRRWRSGEFARGDVGARVPVLDGIDGNGGGGFGFGFVFGIGLILCNRGISLGPSSATAATFSAQLPSP